MKRMRTLCLTGLLWMMTCILYAQNQLITYTVPSDGVFDLDDPDATIAGVTADIKDHRKACWNIS